MSGQILFFRKNAADISQSNLTVTASQNSDVAAYALNRNPWSAYITTESVDSDNTTWEVNFADERIIEDILLVGHNFKSFLIEYWDGAAYQPFTAAIDETANMKTTNHFEVEQRSTSGLRVTIRGTQVPDEDKILYQFIATRKIGRLDAWPVIKKPTISKNLKVTRMLSGKARVIPNVGDFECTLEVEAWSNDADLAIVEALYNQPESFLVWLSGGNEDQFKTKRIGYRLQDLYLVRCTNSYVPEYRSGIYTSGLKISIDLKEVSE